MYVMFVCLSVPSPCDAMHCAVPSSPSIYRTLVPLPASRTNTPLGLDSVGM